MMWPNCVRTGSVRDEYHTSWPMTSDSFHRPLLRILNENGKDVNTT